MAEKDQNKNHDLDGVERNLIEEHEYDGIKELDNRPPPWLMWILYGTIIWSVAYMFYYHVFDVGKTQQEELAAEWSEADDNNPVNDFDETNIKLISNDEKLAEAVDLYNNKTCVACHGANGEGNAIGPNLTDNYWIHGNTPEEVFKVIKYGVPEKGMTPFKDQLTNDDMVLLTSYILNKLVGSEPQNPKDPEGESIE
jgi:cytochrome c oxidase cbb3-type subunit 3